MAEEYYQRAISLPLFPKLSKGEQEYVIDTVLSELACVEEELSNLHHSGKTR